MLLQPFIHLLILIKLFMYSPSRVEFKSYLNELSKFIADVRLNLVVNGKRIWRKDVVIKAKTMHYIRCCLDGLPENTRAPNLNDSNTVRNLKKMLNEWIYDYHLEDGSYFEQIDIYIAFLVKVGFLPAVDASTKLPRS